MDKLWSIYKNITLFTSTFNRFQHHSKYKILISTIRKGLKSSIILQWVYKLRPFNLFKLFTFKDHVANKQHEVKESTEIKWLSSWKILKAPDSHARTPLRWVLQITVMLRDKMYWAPKFEKNAFTCETNLLMFQYKSTLLC